MSRRLVRFAVAIGYLSVFGACGSGEDQPTEPDLQITTIDLTPDREALQRDSAVDFDVEAMDKSGNRISGVKFSWRVQDPTVATVNDTGLVRGLEAGETVVTASAEGEQGAAELKVRSGQTEVVDSTEFDLVSDSAERAQGILRFEASGDAPVQDIEPGDILVGTEQGGFLRRATSVSRPGTQVVVETEQTSLAEAADSLSFESTITLGTGATGQAVEKGNVQWGATYTRYAAPGVTAEERALRIDDLTLVSGEVCNNSGSNCADVSVVVPSGRVQFTPEMDVAVDIGFFELQRFRAVGSGDLRFDISAEASASGKLEKTGEKELYQFSKPFYYPGPPPLVGEVRLTFLAGYELDTEAQYRLETGFDSNYGVEIGAEYTEDSWSEVFSVNTSFDPHPLESELEGKVRSRVFVTSDASVIFYTAAGPNMFVQPYLQGQATFAEECVLDLTAGMDAGLGFKVEILSHNVATFDKRLAIASSTIASSNLGCGGNLEVSASTSGEDQDSDGYTVTVDGSQSAEIDPNGSATFTDLSVGDHEVELSDIASNCTVDSTNPRTVGVPAGETASTSFSVSCTDDTTGLTGWIAFNSLREGDLDIYRMNADGSDVTRLTSHSGSDGGPTVSPDGTEVGFESDRTGQREIYILDSDGSSLEKVTDHPDADRGPPSWSPDGSTITFDSYREGQFDVYKIRANGTDLQKLTDHTDFDGYSAWSPNGGRIAFYSWRDDNAEIYTMNPEGGELTRLTDHSARDRYPAWSPDGSKIAFTSDRDGNANIYILNDDETGLTQLTDHNATDREPSWSPDGSYIAFSSDRDGGDFDIYIIEVDGTNLTRLTSDPSDDKWPSWGENPQ